jgi:hypothetical protein
MDNACMRKMMQMQASRRAEESPCYQLISLSAPLAERDQDIRMQYAGFSGGAMGLIS